MYLLLDHIKGKNYLLYKIEEKKEKKKSLTVATWLVPNSLYTLTCVNYF